MHRDYQNKSVWLSPLPLHVRHQCFEAALSDHQCSIVPDVEKDPLKERGRCSFFVVVVVESWRMFIGLLSYASLWKCPLLKFLKLAALLENACRWDLRSVTLAPSRCLLNFHLCYFYVHLFQYFQSFFSLLMTFYFILPEWTSLRLRLQFLV